MIFQWMSLSDEHGKDDGSQIPGDDIMHVLDVERKELRCISSKGRRYKVSYKI